jgi:hypothetical protein
MEELIWRIYDVKMDARSRTVFSSTVLANGVRVYRKEVWLVPQSGERFLTTTLYSRTTDFAIAEPTIDHCLLPLPTAP